jgi:hypothetical protein
LKQSYKENPPPMGVYAVRNRANGKVLVGSSTNIPGALNSIRFQLEARAYRLSTASRKWLTRA